jgi:mono/diheme cytochrome c family protein
MNEDKNGGLFLFAGLGVSLVFFVYILFIQKLPHPDVPGSDPAKAQNKETSSPVPENIWVATPELIVKGKALYETYCSVCHGDMGKGDGPGGMSLNPKPRDFTSPANWKNGPSPFAIMNTLKKGIPGSAMVAFDLPELDQWALVHYVRDLAGTAVATLPTQSEIDAFKEGK